MTPTLSNEELITKAIEISATYTGVHEQLLAKLKEYSKAYRDAGLSRRWDDSLTDRMNVFWDPDYQDSATGAYFTGSDYDGDSVSLVLPYAWLRDPEGYIDDLVSQRQQEDIYRRQQQAQEEAAARPARIRKLRAELAELLDAEVSG